MTNSPSNRLRRRLVVAGGAGLATSLLARAAGAQGASVELPIVNGHRDLVAFPEKRPLIVITTRPPQLETPFSVFNEGVITPNDAFFVRYHLSDIPEVDAAKWQLKVGGDAAERPVTLSLDELKRGFEPVELAAVCQCAGNRRGLSEPHVPGVEWGYGAMGNAKWKGARLKDVLAKAGVKKEAIEVAFDGADGPAMSGTPDFQKSLPVWKALDENTLIAYEMNGQALPHWNGFPARLIVAGWTGTYWLKHLTEITVLSAPFKNFWMNTAYRIPVGKFPVIDRFTSQESGGTTPITEMVVNSVITSPREGQVVKSGQPVEVKGIAWDNGAGIQTVEVSSDDGRTWQTATLDQDMGRFSFRGFRHALKAGAKGDVTILARATNRQGATQVSQLIFNPAGYHNNVISRVTLRVG